MQVITSVPDQPRFGGKQQKETRRLTPADYSKAGILKSYDWSVEDRETHDKEMEKYRRYLMKLCSLSHEIEESTVSRG
jgi:hypothetical protein